MFTTIGHIFRTALESVDKALIIQSDFDVDLDYGQNLFLKFPLVDVMAGTPMLYVPILIIFAKISTVPADAILQIVAVAAVVHGLSAIAAEDFPLKEIMHF